MNLSNWSRRHFNQTTNLGQFHTKSDMKLWSVICLILPKPLAIKELRCGNFLMVKGHWDLFDVGGHHLAIYLSVPVCLSIPWEKKTLRPLDIRALLSNHDFGTCEEEDARNITANITTSQWSLFIDQSLLCPEIAEEMFKPHLAHLLYRGENPSSMLQAC